MSSENPLSPAVQSHHQSFNQHHPETTEMTDVPHLPEAGELPEIAEEGNDTVDQEINQSPMNNEEEDGYESVLMKTDSVRHPQSFAGNQSINQLALTNPAHLRQRAQSFMSIENNVNTVIVWQNLSISATKNGSTRILLDNVSGCIPGGLWAVMGPSGSGKSTLLNALACRLDGNITVTGEMRLNGRPYSNTELKKISGYVMQDDLLNPHLTVRETLHYAAQLRLPRAFTDKEREDRIEEVIREMGLTHARDVLVGDPSRKGISGGERRRVCIGCELLTRPQLLFMDEPTSGLDSVTAYSLVRRLKRITRTGKCCMVITIHQPQARLFSLFDRLMLLKSGKILFSGSIPNALQLFSDCGFPVPRHSNPADHILDTITPPMDATFVNALAAAEEKDPSTDLEKGETNGVIFFPYKEENAVKLREQYEKTTDAKIDLGYGLEKPLLLDRDQIPWITQVRVLFHRNLREAKRKRLPIIFAVVQTIIMGLLVGFSFYNIGTGQSSVIRRSPACFFFCVNQGVVGGLMIINSFPAERALMLRERAAGSYFVSAYFVAKTLVDSLTTLPIPLLFGIICYWLIGFQPDGSKFMIYLVLLVLCNFSATSLALMISAACKTTDFSVTVLPMALEVSRLFGGFYLAPGALPKYFSWLDALSYLKYSYVGISLNELQGLELSCNDNQLVNGVCPVPNGQVTINNLGLDYINVGGCIGTLIAYIMFCQTVAYLCVRFNKSP